MKGAMYICWIIVSMQLEFLAIAADMFRPAIVWELRNFDETEHLLRFDTRDRQRSKLHIMVCRIELCIQLTAAATPFSMSILVPRVALQNTTAESIHYGLDLHPLVKPIRTRIDRIMRFAETAIHIRTQDRASSNRRLLQWELHLDAGATHLVNFHELCKGHDNNHGQHDVIRDSELNGLGIVQWMSVGASLIAMGNHWADVLRIIPKLVRTRLVIRKGSSTTRFHGFITTDPRACPIGVFDKAAR